MLMISASYPLIALVLHYVSHFNHLRSGVIYYIPNYFSQVLVGKKRWKIAYSYFEIKCYENSCVNPTLLKHNYLHQKGLTKEVSCAGLQKPLRLDPTENQYGEFKALAYTSYNNSKF